MKSLKLLAIVAVAAALAGTATVSASPEAAARLPACQTPPPQPPPFKPTTVDTIAQAYHCVFDNYFSGPVLDSRTILQPAFSALTRELQRRGLDQPNANAPVLTGKRDSDWKSFAKAYQDIIGTLPTEAHQGVAEVTIRAMVEALGDNHAAWIRPTRNDFLPVGFMPSHARGPGRTDPTATGPAHVVDVLPGSAAANAGIKLGDEILSVNDVPLFVDGVAVPRVVEWLMEAKEGRRVKLVMRRPSTGETKTYDLTVTKPSPGPGREDVESKLLPGGIAYVLLRGFAPGVADKIRQVIADLGKQQKLRGVVLDLRGNGGGSPGEVKKLVSSWVHGKTYSYWCDVRDKCTPNRTDDSVSLLNLPLVTLTDRICASACDAFSNAVKDLKFGTLVGARTAGAVSGPGEGWVLGDGSFMVLPKIHEIGPNREKVDTVGVPPDHFAPVTAADLSAGRDPGLDKARALLG
ncbi:S41 family peptidase [Kibdelosporangium phytohabitans]|uniref:S41 family peptidase n=1 Tax=Kibdelosporangium phytohabitans TaxID=860235 RepID=UPI0012F7F52C|nr:S41 family peptidase [Kibdelosporangium phytohabitans]MBE1462878.1 carboxyl-terminal processing protease [Kibdelosporangium phytohabitans]